jgi:hypothetical protein
MLFEISSLLYIDLYKAAKVKIGVGLDLQATVNIYIGVYSTLLETLLQDIKPIAGTFLTFSYVPMPYF